MTAQTDEAARPDQRPHRRRVVGGDLAGAGRRRAARRRRHRAVRRPLPQGGHRLARRRPAPDADRAAGLPARTAGPPDGDPGIDCRAGKADRRARRADRRRRHQGPARGHLPAVQDQAAHQGADRPGGRAGAVGGSADRQPDSRSVHCRRQISSRPTAESRTPRRHSPGPARSWPRDSARTPIWSASCASCCGSAGG